MQLRFSENQRKWAIASFGTFGLMAMVAGSGCSSDSAAPSDTTTPEAGITAADTGAGADTSTGTGTVDSGPQCAGATLCGSACVDTKNDPANCGACGTTCVAGQVCSAGVCALACAGGATKCGDACVDTKVDPNNCGTCNTKCASGLVCSAGACGLTCGAGLLKCDSGGEAGVDAGTSQAICANTSNDNGNCGACGVTCTGAQRCVSGTCALGCSTGADCASTQASCSGNKCVVPADCSEIKASNASAKSGPYTIDPDGAAGLAPFTAWCDMVTDGGGWTIVTSMSGADNEAGLTSDTEASGSPLAFARNNLNRAKKVALSALETESIFVRNDGRWLKANKPMFDATLGTAAKDAAYAVKLNGMNGATADGYMGWSNHDILGGGDFGVSMAPDGMTSCATTTVSGFDHHNTVNYYDLNCNCDRQYLYSYSDGTLDSDASYKAHSALGGWTATAACTSSEGGGMAFYAAMRRLPATIYASCKDLHTALPTVPSGWQVIDRDGAGALPAVGVYCDMTTDGGGYTEMPVTGGVSSFKLADPDSCALAGMKLGIVRTAAHQAAALATFGTTYYQTMPGISNTTGGVNYSTSGLNCAMNSTDATCGAAWKASDNGAWFIRDIPYGEPNGDYTASCWLGFTGGVDANGVTFNDANCIYATGATYVCSDNVK
jgi:hypothetical protein